MDELTEARRLLDQLAAIADRLTRSDRHFLESWQAYLARTGDGAEIGSCRLGNLRKTHRCYFPEATDSAPSVSSLAVSASANSRA